jgi:hypothetical protein
LGQVNEALEGEARREERRGRGAHQEEVFLINVFYKKLRRDLCLGDDGRASSTEGGVG